MGLPGQLPTWGVIYQQWAVLDPRERQALKDISYGSSHANTLREHRKPFNTLLHLQESGRLFEPSIDRPVCGGACFSETSLNILDAQPCEGTTSDHVLYRRPSRLVNRNVFAPLYQWSSLHSNTIILQSVI